jgi:CO/xanthine dehydrogenase Mo-binding subunit
MTTPTAVAPKTATTPALLGRDEPRIDGLDKVSGQTMYSADFKREGMLWAAFAASPHAHARIVQVDTEAAKAMPGVRAIVSGADIGERYFGCMLKDWPILARDEVKFVGEYIAAVAADTREQAEAAAAAIDVQYDELPALFDPEAAIAPDAPPFHPNDAQFEHTLGKRPPVPHRNMHGYDLTRKGDVEAGFERSDYVFEHTFTTPRTHGGYLEPRATLVWIDDEGTLHVICTNSGPFLLRDRLASAIGLPKDKVVIHPSFIGGDFGGKALTIEEFPLYYLALATKRAIKHVRTHADDVRSTHTRHASKTRVRLGLKSDGTIEAFDVRVLFDGGAYAAGKPVPWLMPGLAPKLPYRLENAQIERMAVYTNTVPAGFVRAPGDIQTIFALESAMDMAAKALGIDPYVIRLRNAVTEGDTTLDGNPFARPRTREMLEILRREIGWGKPLPAGRGLGLSLTARHFVGGKTSFIVTAQEDGTIAVDTGSPEQGVGALTVIQRVLAAELNIDPERITVNRGATDAVPFDPGVGGSKGALLLGRAALDAAQKLRAALALPHSGPVMVTGEGAYMHQRGEPVWANFGAYGVDLSVDRDTGEITIHDVVFVADVGTIINPIAHRGQIDGGFMMGLGSALTEELQIEDGRLVNIALSDYKLPCQRDIPPFRVVMMEPDDGPGAYGARAVGEFNTAGVAPAIANAIEAACGVRLDRLGLTAERIYAALQAPPA